MQKRQSKFEFRALLLFLVIAILIVANGFAGRIFAQGKDTDIFTKIQPVGDVLNTILSDYVREPNVDKMVEGALAGMMNSLDNHSSYVSPDSFTQLQADTNGEFEGIGISIELDEDGHIKVYQPLEESPAAQCGVLSGDLILKIDGTATDGMAAMEALRRIRGPKNSVVQLTVWRRAKAGSGGEEKDFAITRGEIPLRSVKDARILPGGVGYIRISDFKRNTVKDLSKELKRLLDNGMTGLVLDLRWNPGGLLTASSDVCELFLPANTLVTYTRGRHTGHNSMEDMRLYTGKYPALPDHFPMLVLVNHDTASAAEIVTGAIQYWARAIIAGEKTYGKGSVQTLIPLSRPSGSALKLTTALYFTPAEVTIDGQGIKPDIEIPMSRPQQEALYRQMQGLSKETNGQVPGSAEDIQLKRAVELLGEDAVFERLLTKYHKDIHETQVAASPEKVLQSRVARDE